MQVETNCPCGRKKPYAECCGLAHRNIANVKTAEDLMRSRYTAFTQANGDYIMLSHHTTTRELDRKQEIADWAWSVEWLRLEIITVFDGGPEDESRYYYHGGPGGLILFPSYIVHSSVPNDSEFDRYTIAFNTFPSGNVNSGAWDRPMAEVTVRGWSPTDLGPLRLDDYAR